MSHTTSAFPARHTYQTFVAARLICALLSLVLVLFGSPPNATARTRESSVPRARAHSQARRENCGAESRFQDEREQWKGNSKAPSGGTKLTQYNREKPSVRPKRSWFDTHFANITGASSAIGGLLGAWYGFLRNRREKRKDPLEVEKLAHEVAKLCRAVKDAEETEKYEELMAKRRATRAANSDSWWTKTESWWKKRA